MIIPTLSEENICKELNKDYAWIKRQMTKKVKKEICSLQKSGVTSNDYAMEYLICSHNSNIWYLTFTLDTCRRKVIWYHLHCIVESIYKTQDYYLWRGLTCGKGYFVRITSHTIRRLKERIPGFRSLDSNDICSRLFGYRECAIGLNLVELNHLKLTESLSNKNKNCYLVITLLGIFFTYKTSGNNIIFKTFISTEMIRDGVERDVYNVCRAGHVLQNPHLFMGKEQFNSREYFEFFRQRYKFAPFMMLLSP